MRAGSFLSVRNATVAHTATQIFAPSAAAASLREGQAVLRNVRMTLGAAHTSFTINSFNPAGAGSATARFGIARPATTAATFTGLNLKFPSGHGCTALGAVGGADGLLVLDGDRVDQASVGHMENAYASLSGLATFQVLVTGAANQRRVVTRVILSSAAAGTIVRFGYDSDGLGGAFQALTPDIVNAIGDFTFTSKIPVGKFLVFETTDVAACTGYVEYEPNPDAEKYSHLQTVVVDDATGAGTVYVDIHGITDVNSKVMLELIRVLGYSSHGNGVMTVGYADAGADGTGANYVPLTADLSATNRTDVMAYVIPVGKKLVMRTVYGGAANVRAHVEYRILAS